MRQHLASIERSHLTNLRVILGETFNKSVCLDLESFLIQMLSGDGTFEVLNRNDGIVNADYYNRAFYQDIFDAIFDRLKLDGVFTRTIPEIINSDLFKLSPFKSLTDDQASAVKSVVECLFDDLRGNDRSTTAAPARASPRSSTPRVDFENRDGKRPRPLRCDVAHGTNEGAEIVRRALQLMDADKLYPSTHFGIAP